jgi:hypothetical protein
MTPKFLCKFCSNRKRSSPKCNWAFRIWWDEISRQDFDSAKPPDNMFKFVAKRKWINSFKCSVGSALRAFFLHMTIYSLDWGRLGPPKLFVVFEPKNWRHLRWVPPEALSSSGHVPGATCLRTSLHHWPQLLQTLCLSETRYQ